MLRTAKKMETDQLINAYIAGAGEVDEADTMNLQFEGTIYYFDTYGDKSTN
jgi:hypothetical protein